MEAEKHIAPEIPALRGLRHKYSEIEASLEYTERTSYLRSRIGIPK
jgi:hypothetical protein